LEGNERVLFLSPEDPVAGSGGGGLRSASLLEYLRGRYEVDVLRIDLRVHANDPAAKVRRNASRLIRGLPPLFDRYSGYEEQLQGKLEGKRYKFGVVEHFWCSSYEPLLRRYTDRLILDLHNIESELARTHAGAVRWPVSWVSRGFAAAYRRLEQSWLPRFDTLLVTSEEDRCRLQHKDVHVYPNALPLIPQPEVAEEAAIAFSGNLEYHPNFEAVRWFRREIWPRVSERFPELEWRLIGRNPDAVARFVSGSPRVRIVGPVTDAVVELARARVCIVPLLSGSGTRFKILEAWAAGRAVVSTRLGAEGLGAKHEWHLLLADRPREFADAIARLLEDGGLRRQLGQAGRALYEERFSWPAAWKSLPF
jgi:glycosyltransferase involved in cell wall biosynthesis